MKKITLLLMGLCLMSTMSFGQYYYLSGTSNPGGLNTDDEYPVGGGQPAGWTAILGPSVSTQAWSANQTIPFAFNFNGNPVTQYKVSSTGVLTFTTGAATVPGATNAALPNASIPDASVSIWGVTMPGTNDYASTKTFGTAPNRQHWISYASCDLGGGWTYWSIVLEEGTDDIYIMDQRHSATSGGVSAGIQINSSTAISVTGSPNVMPQAGIDPTDADNTHYRFIYGTQAANDAELVALTNAPYAAAGNTNITGTIRNLGSSTITTMTISYDAGSGPVNDVKTGLNIVSNGTYNFTHATPLNVVAGTTYNINVNVTLAGDANTANNTGSEVIVGLTAIPAKKNVGEERTGTWCQWCPRGAVGLAFMEAQSDFIGIAVHDNDPMEIAAYNTGINAYIPPSFPGGGVDRVLEGDPNSSSFLNMHNQRKTAIVPCDVKNIVANLSGSLITVSADSEWYGSIPGNYRLSCVIVEDDVAGPNQSNAYGGGGNGSMAFPAGKNNSYNFGASSSPTSVPAAAFLGYDHVAQSLSSNNILGTPGSLPASITIGVHSFTFPAVSSSVITNYQKAHAVVMVIDASTGYILNADVAPITTATAITEVEGVKHKLNVYPNPTNNIANITFDLASESTVTLNVYNAMGKLVYAENGGVMNAGNHKFILDGSNLNSGFYFVNLTIDGKVITKKVSLIK